MLPCVIFFPGSHLQLSGNGVCKQDKRVLYDCKIAQYCTWSIKKIMSFYNHFVTAPLNKESYIFL